MTDKQKIKIIVSSLAVAVVAVHILYPKISIDMATVALLGIAIIPWLEPFFKSVSLPGGLTLQFRDFEKISSEAKDAGLLPDKRKESMLESMHNNKEYDFTEIAEKNPELALVTLRIEIEKKLRALATKNSIDTKKYSVLRLIDALAKNNILTSDEAAVLKQLTVVLNQPAQSEAYDRRISDWVIENGPGIISSLERKIT